MQQQNPNQPQAVQINEYGLPVTQQGGFYIVDKGQLVFRKTAEVRYVGDHEPIDTEWLVEDILPRGSCVMMAAPMKTSKTWCLLDIAIAGALGHGALALGQWPVRQEGFRTLIISPEGSFEYGMVSRVHALCKGRGVDVKTIHRRMPVWPGSINLRSQEDIRRIADTIRMLQIEVIIIDPFAACAPGIDENDSGKVQMVLEAIRALTRIETLPSVILSHHISKAASIMDRTGNPTDAWNALRGSSALGGWADGLISIQPVDDDGGPAKPDAFKDADEEQGQSVADEEQNLQVPQQLTHIRNIATRHRDDPDVAPSAFRLRFNGEVKSKLIVEVESDQYRKSKKMNKVDRGSSAKKELKSILDVINKFPGVYGTANDLCSAVGWDNTEADIRKMQRRRKQLMDDAKIKEMDSKLYPIDWAG